MEPSEIVLPKDYPREGNPSAPHAYYVYFIYCAGRVKIGRAMDVSARLNQISTGSPFRPTLILAVSGSLSAEAEVHARFAQDRVHREWFKLSDHLRRYLNNRLDEQGKAALLEAERAFVGSFQPTPPETGSRKWNKPKKRCHHGKPLSLRCAKCVREVDLRVLDELNRKLQAAG
jgi:hypothetical protein